MREMQAVNGEQGIPRDARATVRYELRAVVTFRWIDREGESHVASGETRDISPKGAFIFCTRCPPRGASLALRIHLPVLEDSTREICMDAEGEVLRIEPAGAAKQSGGFSIRNHWMRYAQSK